MILSPINENDSTMNIFTVSERAIIREMDVQELEDYIKALKDKMTSSGILTDEETRLYNYALRQLYYLSGSR